MFAAFIFLPTRFWPRIDRELPFLAIAQTFLSCDHFFRQLVFLRNGFSLQKYFFCFLQNLFCLGKYLIFARRFFFLAADRTFFVVAKHFLFFAKRERFFSCKTFSVCSRNSFFLPFCFRFLQPIRNPELRRGASNGPYQVLGWRELDSHEDDGQRRGEGWGKGRR